MTPKEKAVELFKKYYCISNNSKSKIKVIEFETAKQCALIAVDEIIIILRIWDSFNISKNPELIYWQEVKQEIKLL